MPVPALNSHGLLPPGVHDCLVGEIDSAFTWNPHRQDLFNKFVACLSHEIRPRFPDPLIFDGSYVTDKDLPDDIDVVLDLSAASKAHAYDGLIFMRTEQPRLMSDYRIHFWVNLPGLGHNDFCDFFQYLGVKTAKFKGLDPKDPKGVLRLT